MIKYEIYHLDADSILNQMKLMRGQVEYLRWQAIYLRQFQSKSFPEMAKITGVSVRTLTRWLSNYRRHGPSRVSPLPHGGRTHSYLSFEEEKELLESIEEEAMSGTFVIARGIQKKAEETIGHSVSKDYAYDLLHRHGWRKISPRPRNPENKKEEQEEYKKNLFPRWMK